MARVEPHVRALEAGWLDTCLADCVDLLAGFPFKSDRFLAQPEEGVALVKGENVSQGRILWDISKYWTSSEYETYSKYHLQAGDVVLAMDRPWVPAGLKWAVVRNDHPKALLVQRCARLRSKVPALTQEFLRYIIGGKAFEDYIRPITTGVNVPHISGAQILSFRFPLPPVSEQRRIAAILSAYDDLIENCERRIRVLDEMARALYREWFVNFRYPGHERASFVETGIGKCPDGWRIEAVSTLVREVRRAVPKGTLAEGTVRYVGLEHIPRRSLALDAWAEASDLGSNKLRFDRCDVLFGKIRPYFHKVAVAPFAGVCSADTFVIQPVEPKLRGFTTCLVSSDPFVAHASATANGAKMPRANWKVMTDISVALPPPALLERFSSLVIPCIGEQQCLVASAHNLRQTRDLLLPRLLSGQLSVEEAS